MPSTPQAEQHRVIACAAAGMAGVFVLIAIFVRASGQPWSTAAGVAGLPTVFCGWYLGALLPLSRHDFSDDSQAVAPSAATTLSHDVPSRQEIVCDDSDAVASAA